MMTLQQLSEWVVTQKGLDPTLPIIIHTPSYPPASGYLTVTGMQQSRRGLVLETEPTEVLGVMHDDRH